MMLQMIHSTLSPRRSGQSTIEYVLLLTGVLTFLIIFLKPQGKFQNTINKTYSEGVDTMEIVGSQLWSAMREQTGATNSVNGARSGN